MNVERGSALQALAAQLWQMARRCLLGGLAGGFIAWWLGLAAAWGVQTQTAAGPSGLTATLLVLSSAFIAALGGTYIGAVRGCSRAVVTATEELDLVARLYQLIKPQLTTYAKRLRAGESSTTARKEALADLQRDESTAVGEGPSLSLAERAERYLASLLHAALAGGLLRALMGRSTTADETEHWANVEKSGLARTHEAFADLLSSMFHGPILTALVLTVLAAAIPQGLYMLLAS